MCLSLTAFLIKNNFPFISTLDLCIHSLSVTRLMNLISILPSVSIFINVVTIDIVVLLLWRRLGSVLLMTIWVFVVLFKKNIYFVFF